MTNLGLSKKELIQGFVQSCIPFVDVPQLSLDSKVMNGEDRAQLLLGHQWEVMHHICLQQHILFVCIEKTAMRGDESSHIILRSSMPLS